MKTGESAEKTPDYPRYAAVMILAVLTVLLGYLALRYGVQMLLPFILAWLLSLLLRPASAAISRRLHLPRRIVSVLLLLVTLGLSVFLLRLAVGRLLHEVKGLVTLFGEDGERLSAVTARIGEILATVRERLPLLLGGIGESLPDGVIEDALSSLLGTVVAAIGGRLSALVTAIVEETPAVLLFLVTFLVAAFYFCLDGEEIPRRIAAALPGRIARSISGLDRRVSALLFRYLRIYACMFLLTFSELYLGFLLLRLRYAFLLALLVSAVDVLPVLGVGSVLLPWAGVLVLIGNPKSALQLLILWGVITLVRQIIEPRLIGDSLGLHPLLSLAVLYAGVKLLGVIGVFVAPAATVLIRVTISELRQTGGG